MMIASMPRGRAFILAFLISIGVLSYWSFDSHIRPAFTTFYPTTPAKSVAIPTADASEILLVSAFYPLPKSKHSMSDYSSWLSRFLQPITTPIYFFTTPDMEPTIRRLRGNLPITINTTYASPFDIPPLAGRRAEYEEMWRHDREKDRHNPDLYAIWTAKPFFLDEGMKNAKGAYKHAFWTDAGSFRQSHQFTAWPDAQRVKEVWEEGSMESGTNPDDLFFIPMWYPPHDTMQYWMEGMGPIDNEFSEGSFFGGSASTIRWWRDLYYAYHDAYLSRDIFVGKDQTLINALIMLNPKRIISVWFYGPTPPPPLPKKTRQNAVVKRASESPLGMCGNSWYYYEFFLASAAEREIMKKQWDSEWTTLLAKFRPWKGSWWTGTAEQLEKEGFGSCRLTRTTAMEPLLKGIFGSGWNPPPSTIRS